MFKLFFLSFLSQFVTMFAQRVWKAISDAILNFFGLPA